MAKKVVNTVAVDPYDNRVVIKEEKAESKTASGIYIPETAKEKPQRGTIVAVGPNVTEQCKVGNRVCYGKYTGSEIELAEGTFTIMREIDIMANIPADKE